MATTSVDFETSKYNLNEPYIGGCRLVPNANRGYPNKAKKRQD